MNRIEVINLGVTDYNKALDLQREYIQSVQSGRSFGRLILLQHSPVITIGRNGSKENILASEKILKEKNIEVFEVDRGGDVTLHCPGQLVGYPIINLAMNGKDVHKYIRNLEEVFIKLLKDYNITGKRIKGKTGVWVRAASGKADQKIVSIGIGVKHWVTFHGFAFNVNADISYFSLINPCGMKNLEMVSLSKILGREIDFFEVREQVVKYFAEIFGIKTINGFPEWIKRKATYNHNFKKVNSIIEEFKLNTVCESAMCPNINECFSNGTATFMILGNICTRSCKFCNISHGTALPPDKEEPERIASAVKKLNLKYVIITSVTRDDLPDGGVEHFVNTIKKIRSLNPNIIIEVLIPDFKGNKESIESVVRAKPDVISHNLETVPRLYSEVRPLASYSRSLELLKTVKDFNNNINTKSGIMLGLGETKEEVLELMKDLRKVNCDYFTIGQYLRPNKECLPVKEFIPPSEFEKYKIIGLEIMNFKSVNSAPFVRSSYRSYNG